MVKKISTNTIDTLLEEDIVSYILENPHTIPEVNKIIGTSSFIDPLMKASYSACVELSIDKGVFNRYDVFRELKSKESALGIDSSAILKLLPKRSFDITKICVDLKEVENKRYLADISNLINQGLVNGDDVTKLSSVIESGLAQINDGSRSTEIYSISDIYDDVITTMSANIGASKFSGVDTGSRMLNYTLGGWQEGMTVIAARPSMGKTIVGLDHAKAGAKSGKRVLFLSLEMPKESLMYRMISSEVPTYKYSDIKANRINQEDVTKIAKSNASILRQLPIFFYDSDNRDVNYLSMILTAEVRTNKIDMVVIDYLQLIRDNQIKEQSDFAQVSSVSNKIQKLSRKLKIPIICLSQLSREIEKRTNRLPQLSDLRSSGNIEQDAIVVIGLYRDDYYKYVDAKEKNDKPADMDYTLKYVILKNRDGQVGDVNRFVDVTTNRVSDNKEDLFQYEAPEVIYKDSIINSMESELDKNVTIAPF
jgi:replicative DNA helicase